MTLNRYSTLAFYKRYIEDLISTDKDHPRQTLTIGVIGDLEDAYTLIKILGAMKTYYGLIIWCTLRPTSMVKMVHQNI
jgi:hypothetical protein